MCVPRLLEGRDGAAPAWSPFRYPLDQVLTMYLLGGTGVIVHAAGALVDGRGIALAGVSGAGKSTVMHLAEGRRGWEPLSDDRVIVRVGTAPPTVHGTPWPGEGEVAENRQGALRRLLFLEQSRVNEVRSLSASEALPRLLQTASLPWYDEEYLGPALDVCGRLVNGVSSAALSFRPEIEILEVVERLLSA